MKRLLALLLAIIILFASPTGALADGIIIPQPPDCDPCPPPPCPFPHPCPPISPVKQLVIRYHNVTVSIKDQLAVTRIDQVFFNPNPWQVEGIYLFPLPLDAAISSFTLWVDGKPVEGQVLEAEQARQQYWEIVNSLRDPALLEYIDRGAYRAHIFPIVPQGERHIELEYAQTLAAENKLVRYIYPLNTEKFSLWPIEQVSIQMEIFSSQPVQAVYSPSHPIEITRQSNSQVRVSFEASQVTPDKDFALYYSLGAEQVLHLLTYRDPDEPQDPDGFFLLLLAPELESPTRKLPKDVILVLDRSGSMEGEKFRQAQAATRYILENLNSDDRFNLVAFSTGTQLFASDLQSKQSAPQAIRWVEGLSALGSTDINRALLEAAAMNSNERPTYLIFLTDGLPTEGITDSQKILDNLETSAQDNLRLFSFGVGYDVDTFLLDSLAQDQHGVTTYVLPGERLDEILSSFYSKINTPLLTELDIDFNEVNVYDVFPNPIPDLFQGSQIILIGRYRQGGTATLTLRGQMEGSIQYFQYPDQFFTREKPEDPILAALPSIWATRKIGYLLNQVRLQGPDEETIAQIVKLSIRYGIVTPYTSYLVSENTPLGAAAQERIAQEEFNQMQNAPAAPVFGQAAVEKSAYQASMAEAETQLSIEPAAQPMLRQVGSHSFILKDGKWIDTAFDPENMQIEQIEFLSQSYQSLAGSDPDLAGAFALGKSVIVLHNGQAYEITETEAIAAEPFDTLLTTATRPDLSPTQPANNPTRPVFTSTAAPAGDTPITPGGCSSAFLLTSLASLVFILLKKRL